MGGDGGKRLTNTFIDEGEDHKKRSSEGQNQEVDASFHDKEVCGEGPSRNCHASADRARNSNFKHFFEKREIEFSLVCVVSRNVFWASKF